MVSTVDAMRDHQVLKRDIKAYLDGDRGAFDRILAAFQDSLWRYLYIRADNPQDAEDIFNEVCLEVSRDIEKLKDPVALVGWVLQIARHALYDFYKKVRPQISEVDLTRLHDERQSQEEHSIQKQRWRRVQRCIQSLPEQQRECFVLFHFAGLSQKAISRHLNLNLNSLKSLIYRAKISIAACADQ
jgi:RNA polymerase sigma-70 factor (ECF subfamily)